MNFSPVHNGILIDLILGRFCAGSHSCCNFLNTVVMLHPKDNIYSISPNPPAFAFFWSLYPQCSLWLGAEDGVNIDVPFESECSQSLTVLIIPIYYDSLC